MDLKSICKNDNVIISKHLFYKHSGMQFRDDGKHWYSLVKLTSADTVKSSNRTLINISFMNDSHSHLPKKDQQSVKSIRFTRFLRCTLWFSLSLQKAFKFVVRIAFCAVAISQKNTVTENRSTPMKTCSKLKDGHVILLQGTQTRSKPLVNPWQNSIFSIASHR